MDGKQAVAREGEGAGCWRREGKGEKENAKKKYGERAREMLKNIFIAPRNVRIVFAFAGLPFSGCVCVGGCDCVCVCVRIYTLYINVVAAVAAAAAAGKV